MESNNTPPLPSLYSKWIIFLATLTLSAFFGALLFVQNLWEVGKAKKALGVLVFAVVWNIVTFKVAWEFFLNSPLAYLAGNALGGSILIFPLWRQHFGEVEAFETRQIGSPLLIFIVIIAFLMALIRAVSVVTHW